MYLCAISTVFPPKRRKHRKVPNRPETANIRQNLLFGISICLYLEQKISKILTQIQLDFLFNKFGNIIHSIEIIKGPLSYKKVFLVAFFKQTSQIALEE